jgi:hypothetical protein
VRMCCEHVAVMNVIACRSIVMVKKFQKHHFDMG